MFVPVCLSLYVCVSVRGYVLRCKCNLIVNTRGSQTMRAYSCFIFLEIRNKESFLIHSLESINSTIDNHKPARCSLSSSQLFVTSPHY